MRNASSAFAAAVARSHRLAVRCDVLFDRVVVAEGVPVVAGSVTYDRNAARLARCTVQIADPLRVPVAADDIYTPFGYELQLWRGIDLSTGPELVSLGVFPIQSSSVNGITLNASLSCEDRSRLVSDARFEDTYQIAAGENYADAIEALIAAGVNDLDYNLGTTGYTTPTLTFDAQADRWEAASNMAKAIGMELLFDGSGTVVMRPEPTFDTDPVMTITEGVNLVNVDLSLDRAPAYNRVIAAGRNASSGDQYRGVATDDDSTSPTYYDGPFGKKPRFFYSEFIASDDQAATAAEAILASNLGVARGLNFEAVPDPRLECSDVVRITRSALGVDEVHIIDSMQIGLAADAAMTAVSRTQQFETS